MANVPSLLEEQIKSEDWNGVDSKYFAPATWKQLDKAAGRIAYAKFIKLMIRRITKERSTTHEVKALADLIGFTEDWDFLRLAMPYLSDIDLYPPQ